MSTATCLFCGNPEQIAIHEVWGHEVVFETCCEGLHDRIVIEMSDDPAWARNLLRSLDIDELCGRKLRRLADDGCGGMLLDWQLQIGPGLGNAATRAFIARHHDHCTPPCVWRFDATICNGPTLLGLAVVGNPVAPGLMAQGILEVNRLCLRRDLPDSLRWNAASMLYGWCAREAKRRGWRKIITYVRADELGTSLRAAGWSSESRVRGRGWHRPNRPRSNSNAWVDKVRWGRELLPVGTTKIAGFQGPLGSPKKMAAPKAGAAKFREETSVTLASHAGWRTTSDQSNATVFVHRTTQSS